MANPTVAACGQGHRGSVAAVIVRNALEGNQGASCLRNQKRAGARAGCPHTLENAVSHPACAADAAVSTAASARRGSYRGQDRRRGATGNNATRANFLGIAAVNNTDFINIFYPHNSFETPSAPGKAWVQWEIVILEGRIRLLATKPDGIQVLLCDWFTPNATATMSGLLPHFGTMHAVAAGSASPASDNFVLYDNLKVESIVAGSPLDANHWCRY